MAGAVKMKGRKMEYLSTTGKIYDKNNKGGLLCTLKNHAVRGHTWQFQKLCAHIQTGDFIAADERGQLFIFNIVDNVYHSLRLASNPVSAIEFVQSRPSNAIVAYNHGIVVVIDTSTKEVIANLNPRGSDPVCCIRCSPVKPIAILLTTTGNITMWDLRDLRGIRSLDITEPVVDIQFMHRGSLVAITFVTIGTVIYSMQEGLAPVMRCVTPSSERKPQKWTSFCSSSSASSLSCSPQNTDDAGLLSLDDSSFSSPLDELDGLSVLSGDNGLLYVFDTRPEQVTKGAERNIVHSSQQSMSSSCRDDMEGIPLCPLLNVIELPTDVRMAVAMTSVVPTVVTHLPTHTGSARSHSVSLNLVILTDNGCVYLTEGYPSVGENYAWRWCVIGGSGMSYHGGSSDFMLSPIILGASDQTDTNLTATAAAHPRRVKSAESKRSTVKSRPRMITAIGRTAAGGRSSGSESDAVIGGPYSLRSCSVEGQGTLFAVTGLDGSIRIYDWTALVRAYKLHHGGAEQASDTKRRWLTARPPHGQEVSAMFSHGQGHGGGSIGGGMSSTKISGQLPEGKTVSLAFHTHFNKDKSDTEAIYAGGSVQSSHTHDDGDTRSERSTNSRKLFQVRGGDRKERSSLHHLVTSTSARRKVNERKLRVFLNKHGQFPSKHRSVVWRFLLRLPENEEAFADLCMRGTHPSYEHLYDLYPVKDRRVFRRLQDVCSRITHWSPVYGEVDYLPQLVFPFVVLFGPDEMSALETIMTILMWWGHSWQATFPNPPVHLTDTFDALLAHHDDRLYSHLYSREIPPGLMCWTLLSTLFSEILSSPCWLTVMDYVFAHPGEMELLFLLPIAIMKEIRVSLLAATEQRHIATYIRQPQTMDAIHVLRTLTSVRNGTPEHLLSAITRSVPVVDDSDYSRSGASSPVKRRPGSTVIISPEVEDLSRVRECIAAQEGQAIFPLPKGRYPAYDGFPPYLVDWQAKERALALAMKREVTAKESALNELEKQIREVEHNHRDWMKNHGVGASAEESKLQVAMMEREKQHLRELAMIEERIARQRIENLQRMEEVARQEMDVLTTVKSDATGLLQESEKHLQDKMEASLTFQKHRELGEAADVIMARKMQKMYADRLRQEQYVGIKSALRAEEKNIEDKNRLMLQKWRKEDDEARLERQAQTEATRRMALQQARSNMEQVVEERARQLAIEHEANVIELERQRALRLINEQAHQEKQMVSQLQSSKSKYGDDDRSFDHENSSSAGNSGSVGRSTDMPPPPPPAAVAVNSKHFVPLKTVSSTNTSSIQLPSSEKTSTHKDRLKHTSSTTTSPYTAGNAKQKLKPRASPSSSASSTPSKHSHTAPERTVFPRPTHNKPPLPGSPYSTNSSSVNSDVAYRDAMAILKAHGETGAADEEVNVDHMTTVSRTFVQQRKESAAITTTHPAATPTDTAGYDHHGELITAAHSSVPDPTHKGASPVTTEGSQRTSSLDIRSHVESESDRSRETEEGELLNMSSTTSIDDVQRSTAVSSSKNHGNQKVNGKSRQYLQQGYYDGSEDDYFMQTGRAGDVQRLLQQEEDGQWSHRQHQDHYRETQRHQQAPHTSHSSGRKYANRSPTGLSESMRFRTAPETSEIAVTAQLKEMLSSSSSTTSSGDYDAQYYHSDDYKQTPLTHNYDENTENYVSGNAREVEYVVESHAATTVITTAQSSLEALETVTDGAYRLVQDARLESRGSSGRSGGSSSSRSLDSAHTRSCASEEEREDGRWTLHADEKRMLQELLGAAGGASDGDYDGHDDDYLGMGELLAEVGGLGDQSDDENEDSRSITSADLLSQKSAARRQSGRTPKQTMRGRGRNKHTSIS